MLDLNDLRLFVHVVENQGFTPAGRALGLPKSSISRRIAALESRLGVVLLERHAKRFSLTEIGRDLYQHGLEVTGAALAAEDFLEKHTAEPAGRVRLSSSIAFGQIFLPDLLARFVPLYPKVRLSVEIANRSADAPSEGFDLLLRAHTWELADSTLLQRRLCAIPMLPVASPQYLDRVGRPVQPNDLAGLDVLTFGFQEEVTSWRFSDGKGNPRDVAFWPKLQMSDMVTLRLMALSHLGVTQLPDCLCHADLAAGRLERVLPEWQAVPSIATLLTPLRRGMSPAVRALMNFLAEELPRAVAVSPSPAGT